ncbi:MAG: hypothetical protein HGB12_00080 [Bacteroidetes bacterium]|nr:hypothetical protein [Bacteroidota bacterium]
MKKINHLSELSEEISCKAKIQHRGTILSRFTLNRVEVGKAWRSVGPFDFLIINILAIFTPATIVSQNVQVLVVGGGGGGGGSTSSVDYPSGGGGGQVRYNASFALSIQAYSVTVGDGGAGQTVSGYPGIDGSNSIFSTITAISGKGATASSSKGGTSGSGKAGGASNGGGGGGGGDNAVGSNGVSFSVGGAGGGGTANSITGTSVTYGGGGGGGAGDTGGSAGAGGGGSGGGPNPTEGLANSGGGGGGSTGATSRKGGSGVVIIRYLTTDFGTCTGGTITTDGSYTIHTFTSSGTFTTVEATSVPTITSPTSTTITSTTATLGANITSNGGASITARGTCWGTSASPTTNSVAEGGTSMGIFTQARTGLPAGTLIYYRGYATNSVGTGYSADGTFTTLNIPTVTTPTATSITTNSATIGANITSDGGATITARGTCWGTSANPSTNCVSEGGTTTGVFTHARTGFPSGTLIYYRGYATNSVGTGYSTDGTFTTVTFATVNWNNSNVQEITLTANRSFTFTNGKSGGIYNLIIKQNSIGGWTISWPPNVKWTGGIMPTFSTLPDAVDISRFIFDGSNYLEIGTNINIK